MPILRPSTRGRQQDMQLHSESGHSSIPAYGTTIPGSRAWKGREDMKIFVVEDSLPVRERLIEMIGELEGFTVVGEAATAEAAVNGIRRTRPDVAIFDIQLATGSGIEALVDAKRAGDFAGRWEAAYRRAHPGRVNASFFAANPGAPARTV